MAPPPPGGPPNRHRRPDGTPPSPTCTPPSTANIGRVDPGEGRRHRPPGPVPRSPRGTSSSRTSPASARPRSPRPSARSIDCSFGRVQFTPDVLPSDVVGVNVWSRETSSFEFRRGPVFASIVLGDEINRASPKTQSALLEAMAEGQVTVDGRSYPLDPPFMVIATQNPIEHEGTYPLPESQLDRFLMRVSVGYPDREAEIDVLEATDRSPGSPTSSPW
ncbi:MAG: AAA family ATPase [Acidimicrobiia bacterium]|nr:AAA family ATPase [Acidimicrobiia bacterium]